VPIDRAQVRHVARLARLSLSAEEEERLAAQLGHVLEYVERLQQVDVAGVEPLSFAGEAGLPLRADEPRPGLLRERVLAAAPEHDEQAFAVPRIVE
jgi:aspartyl-tRNA(Asn)/glutamyl-tRNA(Gln) amidotransferase subunit C